MYSTVVQMQLTHSNSLIKFPGIDYDRNELQFHIIIITSMQYLVRFDGTIRRTCAHLFNLQMFLMSNEAK